MLNDVCDESSPLLRAALTLADEPFLRLPAEDQVVNVLSSGLGADAGGIIVVVRHGAIPPLFVMYISVYAQEGEKCTENGGTLQI
jgi:hypothetical protein